jgi:RimJ/RimL family protein N-acetyltransferase
MTEKRGTNMKIVEYDPKYASSIADMWNKSTSSWGNDDELRTAQDVINSEKNSGNIKTYLALENEEVIGYCSFSEYRQDEGAAYLPLINVRPDYHGKKIGKALILRVLEDAKKSKWPRFDLYTWSGNIKAMPLYKKCGFFWERRNNTVHLMNFIPYVYQTEAIKPYVDLLDLYKDNINEIHMDYDGEEKDGFDVYYYHFKNKQTYLTLGFEKTGRGLVYIDNPDYEMRLSVGQHKCVYPKTYQAKLMVVNKTSKPMEIHIKGQKNKNIESTYDYKHHIVNKETIDIPFFIDATDKRQEPGKTHPSLVLNVDINHKEALLKCGLLTKSPIEIEMETTEWIHSKGKIYHAYLNIENNLDKETNFHIHLPNTNIQFLEDIHIGLKKNEKRSVKIPYKVDAFGFYHEQAIIKYEQNILKKDIKACFKGSKESFVCDFDKNIKVVSGNSVFIYEKESHNMRYINTLTLDNDIAFMVPKIGMPYSLEFNNKESVVEILSQNEIKITFESHSFKDVYLSIYACNHHGILKVWYELVNQGKSKSLSLSIPIVKDINQSYIPYRSRLLKVIEYGGFIGNLNAEGLDEHWMYNDQEKQGFKWPDDIQMKISGWHMSFDCEKIELKENGVYKTKPFVISYVHPTLKDFRHYVGSVDEKQVFPYIEMSLDGFNPFINEDSNIQFKNHKKAQIEGNIKYNDQTFSLDQKFEVNEGLASFTIDLTDRIIQERRYLFKAKGKVIRNEKDGIYTINNGIIVYQADMNHSDTIFSLKFNGHEWLDSNYPQAKERAWWASFVGGMGQRFFGIQDNVAIKEKRHMDFVELFDNKNNLWTGIKITTFYQSDPILKGTSTENYYLTMPGIPLIHTLTKVINHSGKLIRERFLNRRYTLNFDIYKDQVRFRDKEATYKVGEQAIDLKIDACLSVESVREHRMVFYNHTNNHVFDSQKDYIMFFAEKKLTVPDGESKLFDGEFVFFTKEDVKKEDLCLFDYIQFDI